MAKKIVHDILGINKSVNTQEESDLVTSTLHKINHRGKVVKTTVSSNKPSS